MKNMKICPLVTKFCHFGARESGNYDSPCRTARLQWWYCSTYWWKCCRFYLRRFIVPLDCPHCWFRRILLEERFCRRFECCWKKSSVNNSGWILDWLLIGGLKQDIYLAERLVSLNKGQYSSFRRSFESCDRATVWYAGRHQSCSTTPLSFTDAC